MQPNISSPHIIRSSYGFPIQEQFSVRSPQNKPFPQQQSPFYPINPNHHESLTSSIKNMEARIDNVESPGRKKLPSGESSPILYPHTQNKFTPTFPSSNQLRPEETINEQFLRGSCSNVLRKYQQTNLTTSLRNTTHFNPINKFPTSPTESRKHPQDTNPFKNSTASKGGTDSTSSSGTYIQKSARVN